MISYSVWIDIAKAALAPVVATVAVWIAYHQWRVSQQKLVLDLFEKRISIFTELDNALHEILRSGQVTNEELSAIASVTIKSRFLFGRDIRQRLSHLWDDIVWLHNNYERYTRRDGEPNDDMEDRRDRIFAAIEYWTRRSDDWFAPYLRLDQKLP